MRKDIAKTNPIERMGASSTIEIGQWYWIKNDEDENGKWFGCVTHVGSNFIKLESPHSHHHGHNEVRVHFDDIYTKLRREQDPRSVIQKQIVHWQTESRRHLQEIKELTSRLGIAPAITQTAHVEENALVVLSGAPNVDEYKKALVKAKDTTLPKLFEKVKKANEELTRWMSADTLPLKAQADGLKKHIENIDSRIFNISLYAGLTEQAVKVCDGAPGAHVDKLHVMQRKLYMDEECLLNYEHGGMEFTDIKQFDKWIARDDNMKRILPFPRTIVAMQVRRKTKERDFDGSLSDALIILRLENADKLTYLYIRNGNRLYRMNCGLDFGEMIFPNRSIFEPGQQMMIKFFGSHFREMITKGEYDGIVAAEKEKEHKHEKWIKANPDKDYFHSPFYGGMGLIEDYEPFDKSSVHYDEGIAYIKKQLDYYNRVALIIQGLFDRSEVLHPHPPVKTWTPEGFEAAVKLIYDGADVLTHSAPPNFEAYRQRLNITLGANSVVTGQETAWMRREAQRENGRSARNWREKHKSNYTFYRPHGDPGPGLVSTMKRWKPRTHEAVFAWTRERQSWSRYRTDALISCSITVPADQLLNVSAYRPGDYKQFFNDTRTREHYLKWAPMLLAAEEYHAGNVVLGKGTDSNEWRRKQRRN